MAAALDKKDPNDRLLEPIRMMEYIHTTHIILFELKVVLKFCSLKFHNA